MTEVAVTEALGESLSPSQVSTYMTCPAKWYFRYLIGLSEPTTGALALGKAFHGTLARNFRQKMSTGRDMETQELRGVFAEEWSSAIADAALRDDEDADELATTGQILAATYVTEAAGSLQPHAVEQTVQGEIAGVKVRGIVDLLDTDGRVLDFKTASKRPNGLSAEHSLQLTTYAMITPGASGLCRLGHGHQNQDRAGDPTELSGRCRRPALCRNSVSHGAGVHPGRDLSAASQQSHVLTSVLRLLARVRARVRRTRGRVTALAVFPCRFPDSISISLHDS